MNSAGNKDFAQQQPLGLEGATRFWPRSAPPRRDAILTLLAQSIAWADVEAMIRPVYEADIRGRGRKGYSLRMMIKILAAQWLWSASDRDMENSLIDSKAFARFVGLDVWAPRPPSASAIRSFRNLLEREISDDGLLSLQWRVHTLFRAGIRKANLEHRHGAIQEPIFRKALSAIVLPPDADGP